LVEAVFFGIFAVGRCLVAIRGRLFLPSPPFLFLVGQERGFRRTDGGGGAAFAAKPSSIMLRARRQAGARDVPRRVTDDSSPAMNTVNDFVCRTIVKNRFLTISRRQPHMVNDD
jgi:hypothetical protein